MMVPLFMRLRGTSPRRLAAAVASAAAAPAAAAVLAILSPCLASGAAAGPSTAAGSPAAGPPTVQAVRFWTGPQETRVVLDMSAMSRYEVRAIAGPYRIVIDVPGARIAKSVKGETVNDGVINRIRVNRLAGGAQIVLDLPQETKFRHFGLKADKGKPPRIVVDLARTRSSDEIRREREETERLTRSGDYIVILDPGHGGSQPGSTSRDRSIREKHINLRLARLVAAEINARKGFRAVLTRTGDYDMEWQARIDFAREHAGHCFVSLHFNSSEGSSLNGAEVYFISFKGVTAENAQTAAERERLFEEIGEEGGEYGDDLKSILFDLNRTNVMQRSSLLAEELAGAFKSGWGLPFRAVKQSDFIVLRGITMPSVLVEPGYLSNKRDLAYIKRDLSLPQLARCVAEGIFSYFGKHPPDTAADSAAESGVTSP